MKKKLRNIFDQYSQEENHLTNSLLLVLDHNRNLLRYILKTFKIDIRGKNVNLLSQVAPRTIEERSSIPDGYIYTDDYSFCIGIETKIKPNALRKDQILGHLKQLSQYERSILLVLTPDEDEPSIISSLKNDHKNLKFISWITLLKYMSKVGPDKGKNEICKFVYDEFLTYVERHYHMTPFTGINFRDGYDHHLASHYVKRISDILTPKIIELYPLCRNHRPKILGTWDAWYSSRQVQYSVHPGFSIKPEMLSCGIVLANGCKNEWNNLKLILNTKKDFLRFTKYLKLLVQKAPDNSDPVISIRQRHFIARTKGIVDANSEINI